jgi:hypothetical protein
MNHHAPQGTHPETVELDHVHLCSYTPDEPKHETMVETGGVKHQGWARFGGGRSIGVRQRHRG